MGVANHEVEQANGSEVLVGNKKAQVKESVLVLGLCSGIASNQHKMLGNHSTTRATGVKNFLQHPGDHFAVVVLGAQTRQPTVA